MNDDMIKALNNLMKEQEAELEKYYPADIEELAKFANATPDEVRFALESVCQETKQNKFLTLNLILMFHRTIEHQRNK